MPTLIMWRTTETLLPDVDVRKPRNWLSFAFPKGPGKEFKTGRCIMVLEDSEVEKVFGVGVESLPMGPIIVNLRLEVPE